MFHNENFLMRGLTNSVEILFSWLCLDSHEKLRRGRVVVTAGSIFSEAVADELFIFFFVRVPLPDQPGDLLLEMVDLLDELRFLPLQDVPLLDPLVAAGLGIAPVLQGPPLLFQPDHFFLADPP